MVESSHPRVYAYYMAVKTPSGIREFGDSSSVPVRLQMLKPKHLGVGHPLWDVEWKNVYDLGVQDFLSKYLHVWIYKGPFGAENERRLGGEGGDESRGSYVSLLGLYRRDVVGGIGPDLNVDRNPALMFAHHGLLVFPDRYPFASPALRERADAIYETTSIAELAANSKYFIETRAGRIASRVRLGRLNLVEGAERVFLGDKRLSRGIHYEVDYSIGEFSFLGNTDALEGGLRVCYRYHKPELVQKTH
jgi:cell surface protein SprA